MNGRTYQAWVLANKKAWIEFPFEGTFYLCRRNNTIIGLTCYIFLRTSCVSGSSPRPSWNGGSVGSGLETMGMDMADRNAGYQEMDEVDFTDNELVHHVRNALKSIVLVSLLEL